MSDLNVKFHSSGGKRHILIVDDEAVNREILGYLLEDEYDISFAATGGEALEAVRGSSGRFSLILLDLLMPDMHGFDVLRTLKADPLYSRIPVIVLTADSEAEVESLSLGAVDFIPKPYPLQDVILARVRRTIELSENRDIISYTERDSLTGLYNKEFFFLYAAQYDEHHSDAVMDAIIVDINHFHMINERHGRDYGDRLLKKLGSTLLSIFREDGGIVCRREADTFLIYCPHRSDYQIIIEKASAALESEDSSGNLRLRMGVYSSSDKSVDIEHRFDRAKSASDTIRNSYNRSVAVYDMKLHESELYAEQLVDDFSNAIKEEQFQVYFQPKFDIRVAEPVLCSAEALVRWSHPVYGMISPGIFIPLFEKNGLIKDLDTYVWRQTAKKIREWKDSFGRAFPVSVNVSRIDLYDPGIFDTLLGLLSENGLTGADMLLEVTESAYTEDSSQIIEIIKRLRDLGFRIEMDDFGSGYSSLNMVSTLPIDALKLDMMFIRNAFSGKKDTHIIETIIEIADHLSVPVIAEGVETEDQVRTLKELGCSIVQGYYFSKPLPAEEYGRMVGERVRSVQTSYGAAEKASKKRDDEPSAQDVSAGREEKRHAAKSSRKTRQVSLRRMSMFVAVLTLLIAVALFASDALVNSGYNRMSHANERYVRAMNAATELEIASDYLTDKVRSFVVTGNIRYMEQFFEEVEVNRRRDKAVEEIQVLLEDSGSNAYDYMLDALALSNQLVKDEDLAMSYTLMTIEKQADEAICKEYHKAERELKQIYSNKSSDEYKM
ncbi:MAG: EAL domain-containing protein, partial [Firmicutes bacterium]|nr:EAL domain-containing protein [Bacillota bacterium]